LLGAEVDEFGRLGEGDNSLALDDGSAAEAHMWYEVLKPASARAVGTWQRQHFAGKAAMTASECGSGRAFYVGTHLSERNAAAILDRVLGDSGVRAILPDLPEGVEAACRKSDDKTLLFLLNHADDAQVVRHVPGGLDLVTGQAVAGRLSLGPREVAVIRVERT
jgi:beta-galactosidase